MVSMTPVKRKLESFFKLRQKKSTIAAELRGGLVTFLTMSYILLVNPQILSHWIDGKNDAFLEDKRKAFMADTATSTALVCGLMTVFVGLVTNLPFAIGPGMGMNTFFAGVIMVAETKDSWTEAKHSWDLAVTMTFVSGCILLLLSVAHLSSKIMKLLPVELKSAIMVGIGVYQAFVGLRTMRLIANDEHELLKLAPINFHDMGATGGPAQVLFVGCLLLTSVLYVAELNGPILIGIVFVTIISWSSGIGGVHVPKVPTSVPTLSHTFWTIDFERYGSHAHVAEAITTTLSFVVITLFDVGGVMFGIMSVAQARGDDSAKLIDEDGPSRQRIDDEIASINSSGAARSGDIVIPGHQHPADGDAYSDEAGRLLDVDDNPTEVMSDKEMRLSFCCVGFATIVSATLGCSPCIVFLEAAAGCASGARTGLAAVFCGILFLISTFLVPVFQNVPLCASSPALIIVGCFMMSGVQRIEWDDTRIAMPCFLTIIMMPMTASITPGIVAGIVSYIALWAGEVVTNKIKLIWKRYKAARRVRGENVRGAMASQDRTGGDGGHYLHAPGDDSQSPDAHHSHASRSHDSFRRRASSDALLGRHNSVNSEEGILDGRGSMGLYRKEDKRRLPDHDEEFIPSHALLAASADSATYNR